MDSKLPEPEGHMSIAQATFLEVLRTLVENDILTEPQAVKSYRRALERYSTWTSANF